MFRRLSRRITELSGSPFAFLSAVLVILVWAASGPIFHFNDTWQLSVNTGTTIVTFLMVFLIQTAQNEDTHALHLKLDELIAVSKEAENEFVHAEQESEEELNELEHIIDKQTLT